MLNRSLTRRLLRWLGVGGYFALLTLGLLKLLAGVFAWPYTLATFCAGETCIALRFLAVDRWVFGHHRPTWRRFWQYQAANVLGLGIWWTAANLLQSAGVNYLLAPVLASLFSGGFSLCANFLWIWRKPAVSVAVPDEKEGS